MYSVMTTHFALYLDKKIRTLETTLCCSLHSLSELNVSANALTELPSSLGLLRYLRTLYADDNELTFLPAEVA